MAVDQLDNAISVGLRTNLFEGNQTNQLTLARARGRIKDGSMLDLGVLAEVGFDLAFCGLVHVDVGLLIAGLCCSFAIIAIKDLPSSILCPRTLTCASFLPQKIMHPSAS